MKISKSWDLDKRKDDIPNNQFSKIWMICSSSCPGSKTTYTTLSDSDGADTRRESSEDNGGLLLPLLHHLLGSTRVVGYLPVQLLEVFLKVPGNNFPKRRKTRRLGLIVLIADCHLVFYLPGPCDPLPILSILCTLYIWDWSNYLIIPRNQFMKEWKKVPRKEKIWSTQ